MDDIRFVPNSHGALLSLNTHRKRLLYLINLICVIFFVPFSVRAFQQDFEVLGGLLLGFVLLLAFNTACVLWRGREFFHYSIVVSVLFSALTLAVHHRGIASAFWAYPVIVTSIFVLPMRAALFFSSLLTVGIAYLMFVQMPPDVAVRLALSLVATIAVSYVVVNIIQDLQNTLRRSSVEDPLTGLSNRRHLDDQLAAALERYEHMGTPAVILLIDIDRFKQVNDELGHDVGDEIIKLVAKAVENNTGDGDLAFRLGGDEFLVLLNGIGWREAVVVAEAIRSDVERLSKPGAFQVSVSIGASAASEGTDKASWMKQADVAMYQAKMKGRNAISLHVDAESKAAPECPAMAGQ